MYKIKEAWSLPGLCGLGSHGFVVTRSAGTSTLIPTDFGEDSHSYFISQQEQKR